MDVVAWLLDGDPAIRWQTLRDLTDAAPAAVAAERARVAGDGDGDGDGLGARILGRTVQSEKEHQVIAMLQTTVQRMASMIDNVLDFARGRLGGGIALEREAGKPLEPVLDRKSVV